MMQRYKGARTRTWTRGRLAILGLLLASSTVRAGAPVSIVAAENFYGDLARVVAGPDAVVTSILSNPDQDPHLFEVDAATARALADAQVVISNGADYDPWMGKLLDATKRDAGRVVIVAAVLAGKTVGDNPHVWYMPSTMARVADALARDLGAKDPPHRADYLANAARFKEGLAPLEAKIAAMRKRFAGTPITASEPVFGYMAQALGLAMRNERFQLAVMNNTEPSPADVAAFEDDLKQHKVKAMLRNSQADDPAVKRLVGIAAAAHVPVVGVSETEPAGQSYVAWMGGQLDRLESALADGR